jgi:hypothetical protein
MPAGSCHCGAVRVEMDEKPLSVTACNCSICSRYAALWAYFSRRQVRVLCAPDAISTYLWGDRDIAFCHCRICGCVTHWESVDKNGESRVAVNARILPPEESASIPVRRFDGASTWQYLDE